ncbi:MAG: hypothetical protein L6R39_000676 [Caloplaca ligustica]|nr:MAG: hypothetical protein L6R39_000676 [Caloplaca ligustica]
MASGTGDHDHEGGTDIEPELKRQKSSGSVKRARERAAAGLPPQGRDPLEPAPLRITPNRTPPRATTPNEQAFCSYPQTEASSPLQASAGPTPAGPTPALPNCTPASDPTPGPVRSNSPVQEPKSRGPPPKRPPRPEYVPPLPTQTPGQQSRNYWENDFVPSPDGSSKTAAGPGMPPAELSASGAPEFPIPFTPQTPHQPRRNLGPPPSARKGGANFYPQNAFVAPIPEEQSETHSSFASSHVMLTSWGDGPPEYYIGSGISEEDENEDEVHSPNSTNDGRDSRAGDHDESTGLVRKVSIGKPGKPALKSVGAEGVTDEHSRTGQGVQFGPGAGVATFLAPSSNNNSPTATPGERAGDYEDDMTRSHSGTASPPSPVDPRVAKILGGLQKGGALSTTATTPMTSTQPSMSDKGGKRPTRLNLAGPQQWEPRGSATSLPELIRRATRLASNLDRGRTASRIGMLEMLEKEKSKHPSRSGSISDILAAFPSPSLHTPQAQSPRFPSPLARSGLHRGFTATPDQSEYSKNPRGRRCCGLPVWAFFLLCIILLLLIAAAVIIPITLIVLPRQNSHPAAGSLAACQKSFPCANHGISVLQAGSCRCVCVSGFTGASCNVAADSGCTTSSIDSNDKSNTVYRNATMGTSIPRLFNLANSTYSIPLDPSILLSLFSSQNLTCTAENALVTFNGKPQRKRDFPPSSSRKPRHLRLDEILTNRRPTRASPLDARAIANRASPVQAAVTSNGIVFAAPSVAADIPPKSSSTSPSSAVSSAPSESASNPSSTTTNNNPKIESEPFSRPLTANVLDFARTAVLLILQERDLVTAVSAQESMQAAFSPAVAPDAGNFNASVRDLGAGIKINWGQLSVDFGNGTSFGGEGKG